MIHHYVIEILIIIYYQMKKTIECDDDQNQVEKRCSYRDISKMIINTYPTPTPNSDPSQITLGLDKNVWF